MTTYKKEGTTHNTHSTQVNCILTNSTYLGKKKRAIYNFMEFYYSFTPKRNNKNFLCCNNEKMDGIISIIYIPLLICWFNVYEYELVSKKC